MEPKLLDQLVNKIRLKHYNKSIEQTYHYWAKSYILLHPKDMGKIEVVCG